MTLLSDLLLVAGALGAAVFCFVLSRRLARFADLEKGMGGAIAVLSVQVDDMTRTLSRTQGSISGTREDLQDMIDKADASARRLELLLASLHDLPEEEPERPNTESCDNPPPKPEAAPEWRSRRSIGEAF